MLEYITLGILYCNDLTGYDIRKYIEKGVGLFYKASYGSLYPLLKKMLEQGYVTCETGGSGKRETKIYKITAVGKMVFLKWLGEPVAEQMSMDAFMARVYFYDMLPVEDGREHIINYKKNLTEYRKELVKLRHKYQNLEDPKQFYYRLSTLHYGLVKLDYMIKWCDDVINDNIIKILIEGGSSLNTSVLRMED